MELAGQTLHDFVLNLLTDPQALSAFDLDPEGALGNAGLSDISAADVHEIVPLVMDYTPMQMPLAGGLGSSLGGLSTGALEQGQASAIAQLQHVTQALGGQFSSAGSADGMHGIGTFSSPLGDSLFNASATPDGQFNVVSEFTNTDFGFSADSAGTGDIERGINVGSDLASPFGGGSFTGTGSVDGHFSGAGQFSSEVLGAAGGGSVDGSVTDGLNVTAAFESPLGNGSVSLTAPGLSEVTDHNSALGAQALSNGSDTVASALANPAAALADPSAVLANPAAAVSALAGNLPVNAMGALPTNTAPLAVTGDSPQVDAAHHAVGGVMHDVTDQVHGGAPSGVAQHLPLDQAHGVAGNALGNVTDHLHSLTGSGVVPNVAGADPLHTVNSTVSTVHDTAGHAISQSPLTDLSGVSGVNDLSHTVEHNAVTDGVHHLLGNDLGAHF